MEFFSYAITDLSFANDAGFERKFGRLREADFILLRHKTTPNYSELARKFAALRGEFFKPESKLLLHNDFLLSLDLGLDGVHFSGENLQNIPFANEAAAKFWLKNASKKQDAAKKFHIVYSAHTPQQIRSAVSLGADFCTFSPVFFTPNKGAAMGVEAFARVAKEFALIALGGVDDAEKISLVRQSGAVGFAAIRYFLQAE